MVTFLWWVNILNPPVILSVYFPAPPHASPHSTLPLVLGSSDVTSLSANVLSQQHKFRCRVQWPRDDMGQEGVRQPIPFSVGKPLSAVLLLLLLSCFFVSLYPFVSLPPKPWTV